MLELEVAWLCTSVSFWTFGRYLLFLWSETSSSSISTLYLKLIFTSTSVQPWRMCKYWKPWTPGLSLTVSVETGKGTQIYKKFGLMGIAAHGNVLSCQCLPQPLQSAPKYFEQKEVWIVCRLWAAVLGLCLNGVTGSRSRSRRGWNGTSSIAVDGSGDKSGVHLQPGTLGPRTSAEGRVSRWGLNVQVTWDCTRILKLSHVDCRLFRRNLQFFPLKCVGTDSGGSSVALWRFWSVQLKAI